MPAPPPLDVSPVDRFGDALKGGVARAGQVRRERMSQRPEPSLVQAVYASVAVVATLSLYGLLGEDAGSGAMAFVSILLFAGAFVLEFLHEDRFTGGTVATVLVSTPMWWIALLASGDDVSVGSITAAMFFTAATHLGLYFLEPHLAGRGPLLGFGLAWFVGAAAFNSASSLEACASQGFVSGSCAEEAFEQAIDSATSVLLVLGLVALVAAFIVDMRGLRSTATALIVVGSASLSLGVQVVLGQDGPNAGIGFALGAGALVLLFTGHNGQRRFSTWFGAALLPIAVLAIVAQDTASSTAVLALLLAALLGFGAYAFERAAKTNGLPEWIRPHAAPDLQPAPPEQDAE